MRKTMIGWLGFLVAFGSAYLLLARDPDRQIIVSADRDFRFETHVPASVPLLSVETDLGGASTARLSPIYNVLPSLGLPATARLSLRSPVPASLASLAVFLPEAGAWRLLPTTHLLGRFSAELAHGDAQTGSFALLKHQQIEPSEDEAIMMETLIKEAPENAVFAKVFMAYASVPGDFVIIPSYKKILFCDEEINTTPGFTVQSNTLPNGPVSYALVAYWTIGERACSAPLKVETIENVL